MLQTYHTTKPHKKYYLLHTCKKNISIMNSKRRDHWRGNPGPNVIAKWSGTRADQTEGSNKFTECWLVSASNRGNWSFFLLHIFWDQVKNLAWKRLSFWTALRPVPVSPWHCPILGKMNAQHKTNNVHTKKHHACVSQVTMSPSLGRNQVNQVN